MAKSPEEVAATMIASLEEKTGRPLERCVAIVTKIGLDKHGEIVRMLKADHGVGHGYANLIAHQARASDAGSAASQDDLVDAQYSGPKAALRPIYDRLAAEVSRLGSDVELSPKKTYVSLRRNKQFGLIQPSTKTRVDVGINWKGKEPEGRLEASGSFNAMVSHRVR
ncbi:MAG TPA: DUF4287 domain-containing protein [Thermoanaerobaculia bacterium]|nr:DUF4287 domain-containing protein [Thermoanaerobaculia bacterium]